MWSKVKRICFGLLAGLICSSSLPSIGVSASEPVNALNVGERGNFKYEKNLLDPGSSKLIVGFKGKDGGNYCTGTHPNYNIYSLWDVSGEVYIAKLLSRGVNSGTYDWNSTTQSSKLYSANVPNGFISNRDRGRVDIDEVINVMSSTEFSTNSQEAVLEMSAIKYNSNPVDGDALCVLKDYAAKEYRILIDKEKHESCPIVFEYGESRVVELPGLLNAIQNCGIENKALTILKGVYSNVDANKQAETEEHNKQEAEDSFKNMKDLLGDTPREFDKWSMGVYMQVVNDAASKVIQGGDVSGSATLSELEPYRLGGVSGASLGNDAGGDANARLNLYSYIQYTQNKSASMTDTVDIKLEDSTSRIDVYGGLNNEDSVKEGAEEAAKDMTSDVSSVTPTVIASNFKNIAKYGLAKVYGYTPGTSSTTASTTGAVSADYITENASLESLLVDTGSQIDLTKGFYLLPTFKSVKYIEAGEGLKAYNSLQYDLMGVITWAESNAGLEKDSSGNLSNPEIESIKSEYAQNPDSSISISQDMRALLSKYKSVAEGLDVLGVNVVETKNEYLIKAYEYYSSVKDIVPEDSLDSYTASTEGPLKNFFNSKSRTLSPYYLKGVALSASYVPMSSNTYSVISAQACDDVKFITDFHLAYGFNRKALYIDTNTNAATESYVSSGNSNSKLRICTLDDLLQSEKDIVLYVDSNFYNIDTLAEVQDRSYYAIQNTAGSGEDTKGRDAWTALGDTIAAASDTDIKSVAKTGGVNKYSYNVAQHCIQYGDKAGVFNSVKESMANGSLLNTEMIDTYLDPTAYQDYTPLQGYAVVSGIYRDKSIFNTVSKQCISPKPVFISSPNLAGVERIGQAEFNSIYNYAMIKNLKSALGIDYKTTLDLDSPVFLDVYGNICTESGLVIIPAASNATIQGVDKYNCYSAGFAYLYGQGDYKIPGNYPNSEEFMSDSFYISEESGNWELKDQQFDSYVMHFKELPVESNKVAKIFYSYWEDQLASEGVQLEYAPRVYLITEVMRGAPLENVDFSKEGIKGNTSMNKYGLFFAYKLDELCNQMLDSPTDENPLVALPNLAYMDGIEYVIVFGFKIMFAILAVLALYRLYIDSVQGIFGYKTLLYIVTSIGSFALVCQIVPTLFNLSYYELNKTLLSDDMEYIAMLNLEKRNIGREIGVTKVTEPETNTKLYLKIDSVSVPWYTALSKILTANAMDTMSQVYQDAFDSNALSYLDGVEIHGNSLYINLDTLFDSTSIEMDGTTNSLYTNSKDIPYASYSTPYYAILDSLVSRVNEYNHANNSGSYSTSIMSNGDVRTEGIVKDYFTSDTFMGDMDDVSGLKEIYEQQVNYATTPVFDSEDIDKMKNSLWYIDYSIYPESKMRTLTDQIDREARKFVADNRLLIGKISDETFLKVMALDIAVKHNKVFHVGACRSIEIFGVDSRDIIRLSVTDKRTTMEESSKSFSRFIYDNSGTLGVLSAGIIAAVYSIAGWIKPLCLILLLGFAIGYLVIEKLVKRGEDSALEGFLTTIGIICVLNALSSVFIKLSMMLPKLNINITMSLLIQVVLQLAYLLALGIVVSWVIRDRYNMGHAYHQAFSSFGRNTYSGTTKFSGRTVFERAKLRVSNPEEYRYEKRRGPKMRLRSRDASRTGVNYYENLRERELERKESSRKGRRNL